MRETHKSHQTPEIWLILWEKALLDFEKKRVSP